MLFAFRFMFAILFAKLMRFYNIITGMASVGYWSEYLEAYPNWRHHGDVYPEYIL